MKFKFSLEVDGEIDGNDASQEHFAGNRLSSVARELGQNANDARSEEANKNNLPAVISFKKITLDTSKIPDIDGLKEKLSGCKKYAEDVLNNPELSSFYVNALKIASKPKINVLQVTDWNTTGLEGPYKSGCNTPIIAFSKGKGVSQKGTNTAGGSRGIGKNAIFTISALRTIFYSTYSIDRDTNKLKHYSQGKAVFISDADSNNNNAIRKGTGYCGADGAQAIEGTSKLPDWLHRSNQVPHEDEKGLSLFALGFEQAGNWNIELAIAALTTFFSAISQGYIEFYIENGDHSIILKKDSYLDVFDDEEIVNSLQPDQKVSFNQAKIYADILDESEKEDSSVHVREFESDVGKFRLCIRVSDGLPNRVSVIRTGMMITDMAPGLLRFSGKDFAATLQAKSGSSIEFIRSLEGAEHNALQPDRIDDPKQRKKAHKHLKNITKRVREILNDYIKIETDDNVEINELAEFFPYENDDAESDIEKGELNPLGKIVLAVKQQPKASSKKASESEKGGGGHQGSNDGQGGNSTNNIKNDNGNTANGDDKNNARSNYLKTSDIFNIRAPYQQRAPNIRTISFMPTTNGVLNLHVNIAGGDEDVMLAIKKTSKGKLSSNKIILDNVEAGQRMSLDVEFDREFHGAISLTALKPEDIK